MSNHICQTCSYYYNDGFCTLNLTYFSKDYTCSRWTDEKLELDYDYLYRLCKQYIKICEMYIREEEAMKKYPDRVYGLNFSGYDFFLQCCLNDLKRELSLYETKK